MELVRATIELGHALGLRVVAEGVEDATTLELLSDLGCDLAQGYFIGKPKPASQLALRAELTPARTRAIVSAPEAPLVQPEVRRSTTEKQLSSTV